MCSGRPAPPGYRCGRHPRLARSPGAMELATARRRRLGRARGRHPAQFPVVVGPIVVAVTLAATFLPAVAALERRGWTRGRASFVVSVVVWTTVSVVTSCPSQPSAGRCRTPFKARQQEEASRTDPSLKACRASPGSCPSWWAPGSSSSSPRSSAASPWRSCSSSSRRCSRTSCCAMATEDGRGSPRISMAGAGQRSRWRAIER